MGYLQGPAYLYNYHCHSKTGNRIWAWPWYCSFTCHKAMASRYRGGASSFVEAADGGVRGLQGGGEILSCDLLLLNPNVCIYIYIQTYIYIYTPHIYIYICIYTRVCIYNIYNQNMSMIKKNYRSGPWSILKCSLRQWMDIFCKAARSLFLEGFGRGLVQFLEQSQ